jgi:hypothetical protein
MSRIPENRFGYTSFTCNCELPIDCWEPPVYPPMNGEGPACGEGDNRYLNLPRKLAGEVALAPNYNELHDMQVAIEEAYVPAGMDPDPVTGTYINLYRITQDDEFPLIPPPDPYAIIPEEVYEHECFPLDECDPPGYETGHLTPPIPFISFTPINASDPGLTGLKAVTDVRLFQKEGYLCLGITSTEFSRPSGESAVEDDEGDEVESCIDTTECPD